MEKELKKLLLVDDSEIDREILKSILIEDFEIIEAENGYEAMQVMPKTIHQLDAILLDVSMPILDGFSVLRLMREKEMNKVPIFLITAEATQDNVEKAAMYNVVEFIRKPFDREEILKRIKSRLEGIVAKYFTEEDIEATSRYASELEQVYNSYLMNHGKDINFYKRVSGMMRILLNKYASVSRAANIDDVQIDILSKAAYFYDIGMMLIPEDSRFGALQSNLLSAETYQKHTMLGADIIRLNHSSHCKYFIQVCSDMCIHHHERYDGEGFPQRVLGNKISVYAQMCRLIEEFDRLFSKYREHSELQFDVVMKELIQDKGLVRQELFSLLSDCKKEVIAYYKLGI